MKKILERKDLFASLVFFLIGIILCAYSIFAHYSLGLSWFISPYLFPLFVGLGLAVFAISLFFEANNYKSESVRFETKKFLFTIGAALIYYFLMPYVGFIIASIAFLGFLFFLLGERRIWLIALLSTVITIALYVLFVSALNVLLP